MRNEYVVIQSTENGQTVWSSQPNALQMYAKGDEETLFKAVLEAFNPTRDDRVYVIEPSALGGRGDRRLFRKGHSGAAYQANGPDRSPPDRKECNMNPAPEAEGWILVQPDTVARTLEHLDDLIDTLREEADQAASRDTSEWTIREHLDNVQLGQALLIQAVDMDDAAVAQSIIAQFEEVEA